MAVNSSRNIISAKVCTKEWKKDAMLEKFKEDCDMYGKYKRKKDFNLGNWEENFLLIKNWCCEYQEIWCLIALSQSEIVVLNLWI